MNLNYDDKSDLSAEFKYIPGKKQDRLFVILPGILARGYDQILPVLDTFLEEGNALTVNYTGDDWSTQAVAYAVEGAITDDKDIKRITLVGISIGAYVAPHVIHLLSDELRQKTDLLVIDAPFGGDTLMVPTPVRWLLERGAMSVWPVGSLVYRFGKILPKDENIEMPGMLTAKEEEEYKQRIIETARKNLSGHSWRQYAAQVQYMAVEEPPIELLRIYNTRVVYIMCSPEKNATIRQPLAAIRWEQALSNFKRYDMPTAHAAFLEDAPAWSIEFGVGDILRD